MVHALRKLNLYDILISRFVYGESIAQTSQFIQTGAVEAGFTAKSIVLAGPAADKGHWVEVPPDTYTPIAQGALLLNGSEKMQAKARKFYNFLFSQPARQLFIRHGYKVKEPDESTTR